MPALLRAGSRYRHQHPGVKIESSAADTSLQLVTAPHEHQHGVCGHCADNTGFKIWSDGYGTTRYCAKFHNLRRLGSDLALLRL